MTASIPVVGRAAPLQVAAMGAATPETPVHLRTNTDVVQMSADEARMLAGALLTAAAFEPRTLRRTIEVEEHLRAMDA
jgi:hypothetical protein